MTRDTCDVYWLLVDSDPIDDVKPHTAPFTDPKNNVEAYKKLNSAGLTRTWDPCVRPIEECFSVRCLS